jgi:Mor transcription activator family
VDIADILLCVEADEVLDALPAFGQALAGDIGLTATIRLCQAEGGQKHYIASSGPLPAPIIQAIGHEAAERLREAYAGGALEVPRLTALNVLLRNRRIHEAHLAGVPNGQIAREFQVTTRHLRTILGQLGVAPRRRSAAAPAQAAAAGGDLQSVWCSAPRIQ